MNAPRRAVVPPCLQKQWKEQHTEGSQAVTPEENWASVQLLSGYFSKHFILEPPKESEGTGGEVSVDILVNIEQG